MHAYCSWEYEELKKPFAFLQSNFHVGTNQSWWRIEKSYSVDVLLTRYVAIDLWAKPCRFVLRTTHCTIYPAERKSNIPTSKKRRNKQQHSNLCVLYGKTCNHSTYNVWRKPISAFLSTDRCRFICCCCCCFCAFLLCFSFLFHFILFLRLLSRIDWVDGCTLQPSIIHFL